MTDPDAGLRVSRDGAVATLWLDRPGKRNAITRAMWEALPRLLAELAGDASVRVLVVRGSKGTFSAGADVDELADALDTGEGGARYAELNRAAEEALAAFPKPSIGLVQGVCVGGGCQIAVACDLRIADTTARFGITPAKLGIVYPPSAVERIARLVGPSAAKWLLYSAELVDADRALGIGLVDAVHGPEAIEEAVATFARTLASRSLLSQRAVKEMIAAIVDEGGIPRELARFWAQEALASPDAAEGVAAFLERRAPVFEWHAPRRPRGEE